MRHVQTLCGSLLLVGIVAFSATARTVHVPGDRPTIAAGIEAAVHGDTVLVAPGVYNEWWLHMKPGVKLLSEGGPEVTVIDAAGSEESSTMLYCYGLGPESEVSGFTFRNGGYALKARYAGFPIRRNIFASVGMAIGCHYSSCTIEQNLIYGGGNGIIMVESSGTVSHNTVADNPSSTGMEIHRSYVLIESNIVVRNLIGIALVGPYLPYLTLRCNDVWANSWVDYYDVEDPTGQDGNISEDPLFCDISHADYHLRAGSPCAPEASPSCGLIGLYPVACGGTATVPTTWGLVKHLFDLKP